MPKRRSDVQLRRLIRQIHNYCFTLGSSSGGAVVDGSRRRGDRFELSEGVCGMKISPKNEIEQLFGCNDTVISPSTAAPLSTGTGQRAGNGGRRSLGGEM